MVETRDRREDASAENAGCRRAGGQQSPASGGAFLSADRRGHRAFASILCIGHERFLRADQSGDARSRSRRRPSVRSLLSADGIRFIFTSVVPNFINFGPVGIILVAMIGVGLAERSGLIQALIRKIVLVAPPQAMTAIVVTLGVLSSIACDAGYLVLIPLGAAAFHSLGRHPLAGLAAAFAGVAAAFGVNFLVKPIDGILAEMTNDAIHMVDPALSIDLTANFYFGIASSVLLIVVCTLVTDWIVEPRLGKYRGESPVAEEPGAVGRRVARTAGSRCWRSSDSWSSSSACLTLPAGAPLRNPETGAIIGQFAVHGQPGVSHHAGVSGDGLAYGFGAKTIRSTDDAIDAIDQDACRPGRAAVSVLRHQPVRGLFQLQQHRARSWPCKLADVLKEANLNSVTLLLAFIVIGFVLCFPLPNILPKWAILAPVFVPLF